MASQFAVFGGQVTGYLENLTYMNDLRELYHRLPKAAEYIEKMNEVLKETLEKVKQTPNVLICGCPLQELNVVDWIKHPEKEPDQRTLTACYCSVPLIGLYQMALYLTTVVMSGRSFAEFRATFTGSTGHTEGLLSAIVMASSGYEEEYLQCSKDALKILLFIGLRAHEAVYTLSQKFEKDTKGATPVWMMNVVGLSQFQIKAMLNTINKSAPKEMHAEVACLNSPDRTMLSGHPYTLQVVDEYVNAMQRDGDSVRCRYLAVTAPFHSEHYLKDCPDKVLSDCAKFEVDKECFFPAIPVYSTLDGSNMKEAEALVDETIQLILTQQLRWEDATWAVLSDREMPCDIVDFGQGKVKNKEEQKKSSIGLTGDMKMNAMEQQAAANRRQSKAGIGRLTMRNVATNKGLDKLSLTVASTWTERAAQWYAEQNKQDGVKAEPIPEEKSSTSTSATPRKRASSTSKDKKLPTPRGQAAAAAAPAEEKTKESSDGAAPKKHLPTPRSKATPRTEQQKLSSVEAEQLREAVASQFGLG